MIAGGGVLARQHDIAEALGMTGVPALAFLEERQRLRDPGERTLDVEPQRIRRSGRKALLLRGGVQAAARPRIQKAPVGRMRGRGGMVDLAQYLGPRAETGIKEALRPQSIKRRAVLLQMGRLHAHRSVPVQAEPGEI